jgi:hypothetical protein
MALTLLCLPQISSMPLAGTGTEERINSVNAESGPGYLEAVKQPPVPVGEKSILPYVLIGVGTCAVGAILLLVVLKTNYDIVGSWRFVFFQPETEIYTLVFSGTKASGNFSFDVSYSAGGTYTVDGKNVTMAIKVPGNQITGRFIDKDTMTGTWGTYAGTVNWTATRIAATAALPFSPAPQSKPSPVFF